MSGMKLGDFSSRLKDSTPSSVPICTTILNWDHCVRALLIENFGDQIINLSCERKGFSHVNDLILLLFLSLYVDRNPLTMSRSM